jgi:hypothetical protein
MQSVHTTAYMVRSIYKGHYEKTGRDEGTGYVMYRTKVLAQQCIDEHYNGKAFIVKVRVAITPTESARDERALAIRKARPKTDAKANETNQESRV